MDHDQDDRPGWVRLPGYEQDSWSPPRAVANRAGGLRRVRRAGNWTAAALIAGVAAATGYFAHHTPPATSTATQASQVPASGRLPGPGHAAAAMPRPASGSAPVVTSGGSGVAAGAATGTAGTAGGARGRIITWRDN